MFKKLLEKFKLNLNFLLFKTICFFEILLKKLKIKGFDVLKIVVVFFFYVKKYQLNLFPSFWLVKILGWKFLK